ncbi:MAG: UDP-N-acetylmuramoyl-tripeptide--D-alanyl-D-alanine ligase [Gemmatimonadota bacterium]
MSGASFDSAEVRDVLGLPAESSSRRYASVSTDTRTMGAGALFVALQGENFDGADFLEQAARSGARGAVVPHGATEPEDDFEMFAVADTTRALGSLARHHRTRSAVRVVGVTGSSGKTTVKEMLACALAGSFDTHRTEGNLNNRIGLPLSILSAPAEAEVWVLELGTSLPGEIAELTAIADPDDAVVTTVGPAHLEGLGDIHGVLEEKLDLIRGARNEGNVVVGEIPAELPLAARRIRPDTITAGIGESADYAPDDYEVGAEEVWFRRDGATYRVAAGGMHHLRDALLAASLAERLDVAPLEAAAGLAEFRPLGLRGAVRQLGDLTVIADCYNANPESFEAAIVHCRLSFPGRRRVAVAGTMLELGSHSGREHARVAGLLARGGFDLVVAQGEFGPAFSNLESAAGGVQVIAAQTASDAWTALEPELRGDEVVLVKGSRGVSLESVVDGLERAYAGGVA